MELSLANVTQWVLNVYAYFDADFTWNWFTLHSFKLDVLFTLENKTYLMLDKSLA